MNRHGTFLFVTAFLMSISMACAQPVEVRVKATSGGPQIHVDGTPIPPRVFYGSGGSSAPLAIGPEWTSHAFEFTPTYLANGQGTLHFRFTPNMPGEYWIKDLRLAEVGGAELPVTDSFASREAFRQNWQVFPPGAANTIGRTEIEGDAIHVTVSKPADGKWVDFHLYSVMQRLEKGRAYRCSFSAKGNARLRLMPAVYTASNGVFTLIGGPRNSVFLEQLALARDAGVRLITFPASACWTPPDRPQDWMPLDEMCRQVIAVHTNALLIPRIDANAPSWWLRLHPEARMIYDGTNTGTRASISDRTYRRDVCAHLEKITRHLCEAFPSHFAGIHPCGQNTGEWFYQDAWLKPLCGYDPATLQAFREWLKRKGDATAESAEVPSAAARRAHPDGLLNDPSRDHRLIDFRLFQQEEMADHILAMARACRRGSDGKKLTTFFYGYGFEFPPLSNGASASGHYGLGKVLREGRGDIDVLCGPCSYWDRSWGGTGPIMSAAETVNRAGILWLNEDDTRTHLFHRNPRPQYGHGATDTLLQSQQVLLRNTAQAALRGNGCWWMDLFGDGWYNDPALWLPMKQVLAIDQELLRRPSPFSPEIGAIIDEASMCCLSADSAVAAKPLLYTARTAFGRCGAPYGQYLLSDILEGKASPRIQFFLAAWMLTPEQRSALAARRAEGVTRVWCWAPGYLYPDRADTAGIREATGFAAKRVSLPTSKVRPTELGRSLGLKEPWGPEKEIRPLFTVDAASNEVLAVWPDDSPAMAMRRSQNGTDVFVGVPQLTPELVHAIAKAGGAHMYTEPGPSVWAAEGILSVQACTNGPVQIDTGRQRSVRDVIAGSTIGAGPHLTIQMMRGEVRVLKMDASPK